LTRPEPKPNRGQKGEKQMNFFASRRQNLRKRVAEKKRGQVVEVCFKRRGGDKYPRNKSL